MPPKKRSAAAKKVAAKQGPKSSQSKARESHVASFSELVMELVTAVNARKNEEPIVISHATIKALAVCVEQARATGKALPEDDVKKVTECLEDLGESIPDALESDAVAIFVNIAICDGDMGDGERILYLLAQSLSMASFDLPESQELPCNQGLMNTIVMQILLDYLTMDGISVRKKQWVAVLYTQLLRCSVKARSVFENCEDEKRAALGLVMLEETDDILQVIIGHLIATAAKYCDVTIDQLFPEGTDNILYDKFPTSNVEDTWIDEFDKYITQAIITAKIPEKSTKSIFFFAARMTLEPRFDLKWWGKQVYVYLESDCLVCLELGFGEETRMAQMLEVKVASIANVGLLENTKNHEVFVVMETCEKGMCSLNAEEKPCAVISFLAARENANDLVDSLGQRQPGLRRAVNVINDTLFDFGSQMKSRSRRESVERVAASCFKIGTFGGERRPEVTPNVMSEDELAVDSTPRVAGSQNVISAYGGEREPTILSPDIIGDEISEESASVSCDSPIRGDSVQSSPALDDEDDGEYTLEDTNRQARNASAETDLDFEVSGGEDAVAPHTGPTRRKGGLHETFTAKHQQSQGARQKTVSTKPVSKSSQAPPKEQSPVAPVAEELEKQLPAVKVSEFRKPPVKSKAKVPLHLPIISSQSQQKTPQYEPSAVLTQTESRKILANTTVQQNDVQSQSKALTALKKPDAREIGDDIESSSVEGAEKAQKQKTFSGKPKPMFKPGGKPKRYSAYPRSKPDSTAREPAPAIQKTATKDNKVAPVKETDIYDIPLGDEDGDYVEEKKPSVKGKSKTRTSEVGTKEKPIDSCAKVQKRYSAPAIVETGPTRRSQREAAAKAFEQLQGVDASDDDAEEHEEVQTIKKSSKLISAQNTAVAAKIGQPSQCKAATRQEPASTKQKTVPKSLSIAQGEIAINDHRIESAKLVADDQGDEGIPFIPDIDDNDANLGHHSDKEDIDGQKLRPATLANTDTGNNAAKKKTTSTATQRTTEFEEAGHATKVVQRNEQRGAKSAFSDKYAANERLKTRLEHVLGDLNHGIEEQTTIESRIAAPGRGSDEDLHELVEVTLVADTPSALESFANDPKIHSQAQRSVRKTVTVPNTTKDVDQSSIRRTAKLGACAQTPNLQSIASVVLSNPESSRRAAAVEDIHRKPQVIKYGLHGAQNQGLTSAMKQQRMAPPLAPAIEKTAYSAMAVDTPDSQLRLMQQSHECRSRTSISSNILPNNSITQGTSDHIRSQACQILTRRLGLDDGTLNNDSDCPSQQIVSSIIPHVRNRPPFSSRIRSQKSSSQLTRVDENGSPRAAHDIAYTDNIGRLQQNRSLDKEAEATGDFSDERTSQPHVQQRVPILQHDLRFAQNFQRKAKPNAPLDPNERFVPHTRERNGSYRSVPSGLVIEADQEVTNPFDIRSRHVSSAVKHSCNGSLVFPARTAPGINGGLIAAQGDQHVLPTSRKVLEEKDKNASILNTGLMRPFRKPSVEPPIGVDNAKAKNCATKKYDPIVDNVRNLASHDHIKAYVAVGNAAAGNSKASQMKVPSKQDPRQVTRGEKERLKKRRLQSPVPSSPSDSSSSDLTVGSSRSSSSRGSSEESEVEVAAWRRKTLIHGYESYQTGWLDIVKDGILLLSSKEEIITGLPKRYKEKAARMIVNHENSQIAQFNHANAHFNSKRVRMVSSYLEVDKTITGLTETSRQCVSVLFENRWKEEQAHVHASIVAAMKLCI